MYSRRNFLKTSATAAAASLLPSTALRASIAALAGSIAQPDNIANARRLSNGWEFLQGSLGGPWEAWHSEEVAVWQPVAMPHSFNAYDGCDPDVPYYRGNGWYRTHVAIANPFPKGRTLLHFEGAGQTTAVYVVEKLAGKHTGGYDEFVFDITDLLPEPVQEATQSADTTQSTAKNKKRKPNGVPIAVLCDNSRDLDRMPSDLSDFSLYGGMYRHVNLVYVPAVSLETVHVRTELPSPKGAAKIAIVGTLYNPASATDSLEVSVEVVDAKGTSIHRAKQTLKRGRARWRSPPSPWPTRSYGAQPTRIFISAA
jgi:beta-galactosidase